MEQESNAMWGINPCDRPVLALDPAQLLEIEEAQLDGSHEHCKQLIAGSSTWKEYEEDRAPKQTGKLIRRCKIPAPVFSGKRL